MIINVTEEFNFVLGRVENMMEIREKNSSVGLLKVRIM